MLRVGVRSEGACSFGSQTPIDPHAHMQVRKQFEAVVPKRNLFKRLLAGMALIIDSKYRFCLNCGRHDTPEV